MEPWHFSAFRNALMAFVLMRCGVDADAWSGEYCVRQWLSACNDGVAFLHEYLRVIGS